MNEGYVMKGITKNSKMGSCHKCKTILYSFVNVKKTNKKNRQDAGWLAKTDMLAA